MQAVLRQWDYARQNRVLQERIRQLQMLQLRVAPELIALVAEYRATLESYLQEMEKAGFARLTRRRTRPGLNPIVEETLKQLDALDAKREAVKIQSPASEVTSHG